AALVLYVVTAIGVAFGFFWLTTMKFSLQLEDAAGTDPLTRLYNRRTFLRACEIEMSNSQRARRTFSILMLDLDHFKQINDRYGHPVGDMALVATVKCMTESVRGMDTIARWGGEEFAVLLPNCNRVNALELAERIRGNLERLALPVPKRANAEGEKVTLTATIGVAMCQTTDTVNSLISRADQAMYAAKAAGRNRVLSASEIGSGEWRVVSGESAG
ncbi:MAG: GGDEF domain-containing protein, partial [Bryocella sp.]